MNLITFLIFSLATWRVASLIVHENGPFHIFVWIRERVGITHNDDGTHFMVPETFLAEVMDCVWCASVWVSGIWLMFWIITPYSATILATAFAFSTVAIVIDRYINT